MLSQIKKFGIDQYGSNEVYSSQDSIIVEEVETDRETKEKKRVDYIYLNSGDRDIEDN